MFGTNRKTIQSKISSNVRIESIYNPDSIRSDLNVQKIEVLKLLCQK